MRIFSIKHFHLVILIDRQQVGKMNSVIHANSRLILNKTDSTSLTDSTSHKVIQKKEASSGSPMSELALILSSGLWLSLWTRTKVEFRASVSLSLSVFISVTGSCLPLCHSLWLKKEAQANRCQSIVIAINTFPCVVALQQHPIYSHILNTVFS